LTVSYEGLVLDCAYRMDLVVEDQVVAELKCIEEVLPIHRAQLLTYLRLSRKPLGLLINFNVAHLRNGVTRVIC
jgi:GxxExxY protein